MRSSRVAHLRNPSASKTLSRLSIGVVCGTSPTTPPPAPIVSVGDSETVHDGRLASVAAIRAIRASYVASSMASVEPE
jgi:hypothetical protein